MLEIGAVVQLQNSTYYGEEGEEITMCAELTSIDGELRRPLSLSMVIINGTAKCERFQGFILALFILCSPISDGLDFIVTTAVSDIIIILFPVISSLGNTRCITITLINDTLFEANEDFVVELRTNDPSVMISENANLAVVTIEDTLNPLCKI